MFERHVPSVAVQGLQKFIFSTVHHFLIRRGGGQCGEFVALARNPLANPSYFPEHCDGALQREGNLSLWHLCGRSNNVFMGSTR